MTKAPKDNKRRRRQIKPHSHGASHIRWSTTALDPNVIICRRCGQSNNKTAQHCSRCNAGLRPISLSVVTLAGPALLLISIITFLVMSIIAIVLKNKEYPYLIVALNILFNLCGIAIFLWLRYGNRLAWIVSHIFWLVSILFYFYVDLVIFQSLGFLTLTLAIIFFALSLYFQTHRVRAFYSIKKGIRELVFIIFIAILAAIPFSRGKYFEFNSPGAFDSGAYVYSAKHILDGAEIGVEEKPSAKLGTLTLNMLGVKLCGFSDTGPKIVQMVLQLAALALMFFAVKRVFGILPAGVSVIIASSYLSAPFIAKFGNVKEQYMIAFMVMGISCFVMRQTGGKWFWALLAGGFVSWAPLFKETGTTVIGAIGLFVIAQPILKSCHLILIRLFGVKISIRQLIRTWKQTGIEILLLSAGAIAAISPFYIWILGWNIKIALPYSFVWKILIPAKAGSDTIGGSYISGARQLRSFSEQLPIVLRYYWLLILPIALALGAILAGIVRVIVNIVKIIMEIVTKTMKNASADQHDSLVLLFAVWWLLDMAFVWISPRSYEQYYLPLCASAAMLGAYLIAIYSRLFSRQFNRDFFKSTEEIVKRVFIIVILVFIGIIGMIMMSTLSWHVFFGIKQSPYSGIIYTNAAGKPEGRNGYAQRLREISSRRRALRKNLDGKYPWEEVGEYIRDNSSENDKIFVWGWYPGIYVAAQRLAPTSWPFTSEMHTKTPERFANDIKALLAELEQERPKYIVDSRKQHFPYDRPPLELWPISEYQILQRLGIPTTEPDKAYKAYAEWLAKTYGPDEAGRFMAMKPFREFIRKNYELVQAFGPHILFKLKTSPAGQE